MARKKMKEVSSLTVDELNTKIRDSEKELFESRLKLASGNLENTARPWQVNELYLQRLDAALQHFERYQRIEGKDKQVTKWIVDLKRRLNVKQRTAKVAE